MARRRAAPRPCRRGRPLRRYPPNNRPAPRARVKSSARFRRRDTPGRASLLGLTPDVPALHVYVAVTRLRPPLGRGRRPRAHVDRREAARERLGAVELRLDDEPTAPVYVAPLLAAPSLDGDGGEPVVEQRASREAPAEGPAPTRVDVLHHIAVGPPPHAREA